MVDMQVIKERLLRGAYVGAGSFASSFAATAIESKLGVGDMGSAAGQVVTGLGVSVAVDEVFSNPDSLPNDAVEFAGYGVQGAGFSNLAESLVDQQQTGRVVSVSSNNGQRRAQAQETSNTNAAGASENFSLDTA